MKYIQQAIVACGIFLSIVVCLFAVPVQAQEDFGLERAADQAKLNLYADKNNLPKIAGNVIGVGLSLVGVLFFIIILYAGFMWMTAQGNDETVKKSLLTIMGASAGLVVVLSAWGITNFIFSSVERCVPIGNTASDIEVNVCAQYEDSASCTANVSEKCQWSS